MAVLPLFGVHLDMRGWRYSQSGLAVFILFVLSPSLAAAAPRFMLGLESGVCTPTESGFLDDDCHGLFAGIRFAPLDLQISASNLGTFKNDERSSTNIEVSTLSLLVVPHIKLSQRWSIDALAGITAWHAKARMLGFNVGEDDGQSWTLGAGAAWSITHFFDLRLRWQHYRDISGTDINAATLGANFAIGRRAP